MTDEMNGNSPFSFRDQAIGEVLRAQSESTFDVFEQTTLAHMEAQNEALVAAHSRLLGRLAQIGDPTHRNQLSAGYLLGYQVLDQASNTLFPVVQESDVLSYEARIEDDPDRLDDDFYEDYNAVTAVQSLVVATLRFRESKFGAKLIFEFHGDLVNPTRPPRNRIDATLDRPSTTRSQPDSRGGKEVTIGDRMTKTSQKRRLAALTGNARY